MLHRVYNNPTTDREKKAKDAVPTLDVSKVGPRDVTQVYEIVQEKNSAHRRRHGQQERHPKSMTPNITLDQEAESGVEESESSFCCFARRALDQVEM